MCELANVILLLIFVHAVHNTHIHIAMIFVFFLDVAQFLIR